MDAFLSSKGRFTIVVATDSPSYHQAVALSISRNLYQYYAADTEILSSDDIPRSAGNAVVLGLPKNGSPVSFTGDHLVVTDASGNEHRYRAVPGLGAIFLQPLSGDRLLLSIWGVDEEGLRLAARLVPLRTGVGAPEFVVVGREMGWMGVAGTKAMGMFDSKWGLKGLV
jgi:hypothetical protein